MIIENALYIVATPIGNLADMSIRAIDILKACDFIAAEDTRHSARLMQHFDVGTHMQAYHDYSPSDRAQEIIDRIIAGSSVALISDAGTPLISDPGYRLVKVAKDCGVKVIAVPGACALIAALSVSGLPSDRFVFEGFVPSKSVARKSAFECSKLETRTSIYYESPHRILDSLEDLEQVLGKGREVVLAREITKTFETILAEPIERLVDLLRNDSNQQKGEMVILIKGAEPPDKHDIPDDTRHVMTVLMNELPLKQAASLTSSITGCKKNALYQWGLDSVK